MRRPYFCFGVGLNNVFFVSVSFLGGMSGIAAGAKPATPISDALAMEFAFGAPNSRGGVHFLGQKLITSQSVLVVECKFCSQGSTYGTPRLQNRPKRASDCGPVILWILIIWDVWGISASGPLRKKSGTSGRGRRGVDMTPINIKEKSTPLNPGGVGE